MENKPVASGVYELKIERVFNEFEVVSYSFPEDAFGKKLLSIMLGNIAQHLNDEATDDQITDAVTE